MPTVRTLREKSRKNIFWRKMDTQGSNSRSWRDMNHDILVKIFMFLSIEDMIFGASQVCRAWRSTCHDPALWATIDLNRVHSDPMDIFPCEPSALLDGQTWGRVMHILRIAFDYGRDNVTRFIFNYCVNINNVQLVYVATRFRKVKHLVLPPYNEITVDGFHAATQVWEGLESLIVPSISDPSEIMQVIGANCKNFYKLKLMVPIDLDLTTSLSVYIPNLKVLSLRSSIAEKNALIQMLKLMRNLEKLNISHCQIYDIPVSPGSFSIECKGVDNSIIKEASRIKELFICPEQSCSICEYEKTGDYTDVVGWFEHKKRLWEGDEISCLSLT